MIKELLLKISNGIDEKDLSHKEIDFIKFFDKYQAVSLEDGIYKLKPKHYFGTVDLAMSGTGFVKAMTDEFKQDLLVESNDLLGASRGDIVVVKRVHSGARRPKAKVVAIIKRKYTNIVVYLKKSKKHTNAYNIKTDILTPINASQKALRLLPQNSILVVDSLSGDIKEVLGVIEDPRVDEKISLALFNKKRAFSKEALSEIKSYGDSVDASLYKDRVDLRHLPFATIDPVDAKDFDDAIFYDEEKSTIYVAIADVSSYVYPFSKLDKEAKERGFSIYFPHKSIPMLPRKLSENLCSLNPLEDRLAYTFKIKLNPSTLEVESEELFESIIKSKRRFNYDEVDELLESKSYSIEDEEVSLWILRLAKFIKKVREKRLQSGYEFDTDEINLHLNKDTKLLATSISEYTASHALVEDCMLLANKAAAKKIHRGIFRVHEDISLKSLEALLEDLIDFGIEESLIPNVHKLIQNIQKKAEKLNIKQEIDRLIIRAQKQAFYSSEKKGHFGLGFKAYSHFTSPIRRYSDLLLHRILKSLKDTKQTSFLLTNIEEDCKKISNLERESDKVARDFKDRKYARWAEKHINQTYPCIIKDNKKLVVANTLNPIAGARILLLEDENIGLFEHVEVQIMSVDILKAKIYGKIVETIPPSHS